MNRLTAETLFQTSVGVCTCRFVPETQSVNCNVKVTPVGLRTFVKPFLPANFFVIFIFLVGSLEVLAQEFLVSQPALFTFNLPAFRELTFVLFYAASNKSGYTFSFFTLSTLLSISLFLGA